MLIGLPLSTAISAYTALGAFAEAEELLKHDVPEPMFRTVFGIQYLRARGHHHLATDRPFAALGDFETCGRLLREGNPSLQKGIPWRSDLALANLRIGKARTAREWAEEQLRLPGGHSSRPGPRPSGWWPPPASRTAGPRCCARRSTCSRRAATATRWPRRTPTCPPRTTNSASTPGPGWWPGRRPGRPRPAGSSRRSTRTCWRIRCGPTPPRPRTARRS
ncbi:hypothetical protein ACFQ3Z_04930 [Streptomyces nogalater]